MKNKVISSIYEIQAGLAFDNPASEKIPQNPEEAINQAIKKLNEMSIEEILKEIDEGAH